VVIRTLIHRVANAHSLRILCGGGLGAGRGLAFEPLAHVHINASATLGVRDAASFKSLTGGRFLPPKVCARCTSNSRGPTFK